MKKLFKSFIRKVKNILESLEFLKAPGNNTLKEINQEVSRDLGSFVKFESSGDTPLQLVGAVSGRYDYYYLCYDPKENKMKCFSCLLEYKPIKASSYIQHKEEIKEAIKEYKKKNPEEYIFISI